MNSAPLRPIRGSTRRLTPLARALDQVDAWVESPSLVLLAESPIHWPILRTLLASGGITGPMIHDERVAALGRQDGVRELWSADRDFGRFPELSVPNPLVGG
jgi:predicted nucleic acid-binding protein